MSDEKKKKPDAPDKHHAVHTDINTVRRNERSIRRMKRLLALLMVILIGLAIYMTYPMWMPKLEGIFDKPVTTIHNDGKAEGGNFPIEPTEKTTNILALGNQLMTADAHSLTLYSSDGEKTDSFAHAFSKPVERVCGKRALVFDSGAYGFKLYSKKGEIYSKTTDDIILSGSLSENGTAAILTESSKYASLVLFYDKDGKLVYRYGCTSRVMAVSVTEDGKSAYVCTFCSQDGEIFSQVRRLDFSQDGEQMVSEDIRTLAIDCICNDAGDILVAGDTGLYTVSPEGKLVSSYEFDGTLSYAALGRGCSAAIVANATDNDSTLVIAASGAEDTEAFRTATIDSSVKKLSIADDRVLMLTDSKVLSYAFSGTLAAEADVGREYVNFIYADSAVYLAGKRGIDKIKFEM
ncbi:hypothetical protein SAMN02910447_01117 [Ruminococcus sp. YE71]|uniref:DUF5711 family protein n=1 Tax=unclassified Ruminococcus TaxID=2608920 RepID=UPI00087E73FE|nr:MULTISPECIES: DUF5711 family protein [unclassified Ruminococcus]SDA16251.1 hypothetical protein SAMN02910446_01116 [Ruminococcus sp. YE78]SFW24332.1 hypothetical protein SAMN02910447_01117 [Ruminococcus sp. YE71]